MPNQDSPAKLEEAISALGQEVNRLEPAETQDTPEDWSKQVERVAQVGVEDIKYAVSKLSQYLDDPDQFLAAKLEAYRAEIEIITAELSRQTGNANINLHDLSVSIRMLDQQPETLDMEEQRAKAKKLIAEEPHHFIEKYEKYKTMAGAENLLQEAVRNCTDLGAPSDLYESYELLKDMPFFEVELVRALEKLKKEDSPLKLFDWISGMCRVSPDFIKRQDVSEILPRVFETALLEDVNYLTSTNYVLYAKEPWFEPIFEKIWAKLCVEKPSKALALLENLYEIPEFSAKPYIRESVHQLVQNMMGINRSRTILMCHSYKDFYEEQDWIDLLTKQVRTMQMSELVEMMNYFTIMAVRFPPQVLDFIMDVAATAAPAELVSSYADYKDNPKSKEYFNKAAETLKTLDPGRALKILAQDRREELPFEDRNAYIAEVATLAIKVNPSSAVVFSYLWQDIPNAKSLFETAQKRSLVAAALMRYPLTTVPEKTENELMSDPALDKVELIDRTWLPPDLDNKQFGEMAAMISRNLYLAQDTIPTEATVRAEYERILATREKYKDTTLFEDRNIIVASHIERWDDGTDRFGKASLIDGLKKQQGAGKEFQHFEAQKNNIKELKKTKMAILEKIETMPSPMTFLFDGHGSPDALYLSDGQMEELQPTNILQRLAIRETENTVKITVDELATSLAKRSKLIGEENVSHDILMFSSCYNHTFLRSMYEHLDALGAGKPIAFGESEYGQISYSNKESPYGSTLLDELITPAKTVTFGDIWNLPYNAEMNPSLYIPTNGTPQQVAENEPTKPDERFAA